MKKRTNIISALKDKRLFGSLFPDLSSWSAWLVFLKASFGIEMDAASLSSSGNAPAGPHRRRVARRRPGR